MVYTSDNEQAALRQLIASKLAHANSTIPFLKAVVGEIAELSSEHRSIQSRLAQVGHHRQLQPSDDLYSEELNAVENSAAEIQERLAECCRELRLVDGLSFNEVRPTNVDFPLQTDSGLILFCWELGESKVGHWHWANESCEFRKDVAELSGLNELGNSLSA